MQTDNKITGFQQTVSQQVGNPLCSLHINLAPRQRFYVRSLRQKEPICCHALLFYRICATFVVEIPIYMMLHAKICSDCWAQRR